MHQISEKFVSVLKTIFWHMGKQTCLNKFLVTQNLKITNRMEGAINSLNFFVVYKNYSRILSANSRQKLLENHELQENRGLYTVVTEDIESNGASDCLEKTSTRLVTHSLAP